MRRLTRHDPEGVARMHPSRVEAIVQAHAEQLHGAMQLQDWKKERGLAPV